MNLDELKHLYSEDQISNWVKKFQDSDGTKSVSLNSSKRILSFLRETQINIFLCMAKSPELQNGSLALENQPSYLPVSPDRAVKLFLANICWQFKVSVLFGDGDAVKVKDKRDAQFLSFLRWLTEVQEIEQELKAHQSIFRYWHYHNNRTLIHSFPSLLETDLLDWKPKNGLYILYERMYERICEIMGPIFGLFVLGYHVRSRNSRWPSDRFKGVINEFKENFLSTNIDNRFVSKFAGASEDPLFFSDEWIEKFILAASNEMALLVEIFKFVNGEISPYDFLYDD